MIFSSLLLYVKNNVRSLLYQLSVLISFVVCVVAAFYLGLFISYEKCNEHFELMKQEEASRDRDEKLEQSYQNLKRHREELERRGQSRRRFDDF